MTALDLLRARFPESEGWRCAVGLDGISRYAATAERQHVYVGGPVEAPGQWVSVSGQGSTGELAVAALISAWDAATHAEKVRELVRTLRNVVPFAACIEECPVHQNGPDTCSESCGGEAAVREARQALAALPEHWKEVPRGK